MRVKNISNSLTCFSVYTLKPGEELEKKFTAKEKNGIDLLVSHGILEIVQEKIEKEEEAVVPEEPKKRTRSK